MRSEVKWYIYFFWSSDNCKSSYVNSKQKKLICWVSFFSWRIFQGKKIAFAKILVRRLRTSSFENESELFHPFEVLMLHEFFSLKRCWWIDRVKDWSCLKEREKWVEWKATLDNMIGCFEREWWKGNDGERAGCGFASIFCTVWSSCLAMLFD